MTSSKPSTPDDDDSDLVDEDPSWECPSCGETWSAWSHSQWRERYTDQTVDAIVCPTCADEDEEDDDDDEPT